MSSAPAKSPVSEMVDHIRDWANSLTANFSGGSAQFEVLPQAPPEVSPAAENHLWLVATFSGVLDGQLAFRMTAAAAGRLAGGAEETDQPISPQIQATVLDLFRKAALRISAPPGSAGQEMQIEVELAAAPAWSTAPQCGLRGNLPAPVIIEIFASDALLASLQRGQARPAISASNAAAAPNKLDMLMDIELVVTMRFGGRRMFLKDILDLCTGSVVELDQQVQEPVDLLLDGKLIARGEVVVVDGNYGLRVTELLSKADSLR